MTKLSWVVGLFLPLMIPVICNSQTPLVITGQIIDDETRKPLSFASVSVKSKPVGTVSNEDGVFTFDIPSEYFSDTLMISMLGYGAYLKSMKDIHDQQKLLITLKVKTIQLADVVVHGTQLSAKEIVKKALSKIEQNYPIRPYSIDAFFRETHEENNKSVQLAEAAVSIEDDGYKSPQASKHELTEKVSLKNVRASKNYRNHLLKQTVIERYNLLFSALRCNPVKYRNKAKLLKSDFVLDSVIYSRGKELYVIHFLTYISRYPNFERRNTLYIDAENYAICKYGSEEYAKHGIYSEKPWSLIKEDSTFKSCRKRISTIYEYESYNGKMYLKYFDEKCYDDIYNTKKKTVEFEMLGQTTLVVTSIQPGLLKVDDNSLMKIERSLGDQATPYRPGFWITFNQMVPLTAKQVRDLEWEMPLNEQFKITTDNEQFLYK